MLYAGTSQTILKEKKRANLEAPSAKSKFLDMMHTLKKMFHSVLIHLTSILLSKFIPYPQFEINSLALTNAAMYFIRHFNLLKFPTISNDSSFGATISISNTNTGTRPIFLDDLTTLPIVKPLFITNFLRLSDTISNQLCQKQVQNSKYSRLGLPINIFFSASSPNGEILIFKRLSELQRINPLGLMWQEKIFSSETNSLA